MNELFAVHSPIIFYPKPPPPASIHLPAISTPHPYSFQNPNTDSSLFSTHYTFSTPALQEPSSYHMQCHPLYINPFTLAIKTHQSSPSLNPHFTTFIHHTNPKLTNPYYSKFGTMTSSLAIATLLLATLVASTRANFNKDFAITWGDGRAKILNNGDDLTLSLDKASGSGFQSKNEYLFGKIDMQIKLVPDNSAGTVTAYYLSSMGPTHDEIDFEFLGNVTGQPYILHTNVFTLGKGDREQQFYLWFDPTKDFHTYSILWNPQRIVFSVDGTPIREFKNMESNGIPFPKNQPMRIYSSLWNADDWATQGGRVKADWTQAPFTASYRNFKADACVWASGSSSCGSSSASASSSGWLTQELDSASLERMKWAQKNYMIYNYCADAQRFPQGLPKECTASS